MTKPWKLKTNASNILLVLITLILVKAEWSLGKTEESWESDNLLEENEGHYSENNVQVYVGNDEIAQFFFHSSAYNNSLILEDINKCLENFQLITCLKMLLLDRINDVMTFLEDPKFVKADLKFLNGLLVFKTNNDTNSSVAKDQSDNPSLDDEITFKIKKIFENRTLRVNLLPRIKLDIAPKPQMKDGFICFTYNFHRDSEVDLREDDISVESRGRKKKKGGGFNFMMLPPLIMMGLMPFTLASLKSLVMNAMMINMMALNGLIFMTVRNLIFGPRPGPNVKYVNYGYSKDRQTQSPKPTLIIHSAAAFVHQPKVRKKPIRRYPPQGQTSGSHSSPDNHGGFDTFQLAHVESSNGGHHKVYHGEEYVIKDLTYDHDYHNRHNPIRAANNRQVPGGNRRTQNNLRNNNKNLNLNGYQRNSTFIQGTNINGDLNLRSGFASRTSEFSQTPQKASKINSGFERIENPADSIRSGHFNPSPRWDPILSEQLSYLKTPANISGTSKVY